MLLDSMETARLSPASCSSKRAVDLRHPAVPPASEPETAAYKHSAAQLEKNGIQLPAADTPLPAADSVGTKGDGPFQFDVLVCPSAERQP